MAAFRRIVLVAALAGLIAGLFVTIMHEIGTVPIILKAETFEKAAGEKAAGEKAAGRPAVPPAHTMPGMAHDDAAGAWEPKEGFERKAFAVLANETDPPWKSWRIKSPMTWTWCYACSSVNQNHVHQSNARSWA